MVSPETIFNLGSMLGQFFPPHRLKRRRLSRGLLGRVARLAPEELEARRVAFATRSESIEENYDHADEFG